MIAPARQFLPRFLQRRKPFHVQTFIPQPPVKTFDEAIFHGPAWPDETKLHAGMEGPDFHSSPSEFAAIIQGVFSVNYKFRSENFIVAKQG